MTQYGMTTARNKHMTRAFNKVFRPIVGVIKRQTEKAILLVIRDPEALTPDDEEIENWIPKSQVHSILPLKDVKGNSCVMMSEWIIGEKSLGRFISKTNPTVTSYPEKSAHPAAPKTPPPATHWADLDDDIPY